MQVTLDPDRGAFCFIGQHAFTFGEPGPKEIDIEDLSPEEKKQLLYNLRRGVLIADDPDIVNRLAEPSNYATPDERPIERDKPIQITSLSPQEAIEKDLEELKTLLKGKVATIKRQASDLRPARARKLLELERSGKSRKSVISFLEKLTSNHASMVTEKISEELVPKDRVQVTQLSTQLTDIVESEEEEVTINPAQE
jgi:hypothetical protein